MDRDSSGGLLERVIYLLEEKKFENALALLKSSDNETQVKENCWDLITAICTILKKSEILQSDNTNISEEILSLLVDKGNPKEVLVALLEQADCFKDDGFFCLLLNPLVSTLKKVPGKRGKSLQWVLSTLNAHLETLPSPQNSDWEGEEKLLLDLDPAVQRTSYVTDNYLRFLEAFVEEVSFDAVHKMEFTFTDRISSQREILQKYLLKLLYHPFLFQDIQENYGKPKSKIRFLCEKTVKFLSKICSNFFSLHKFLSLTIVETDSVDSKEEFDSIKIPKLAYSNLLYLVFSENIAPDSYPLVYSNSYLFLTNLSFAEDLLSVTDNLVVSKGLYLSNALLGKLSDLELHHNCMELKLLTAFPDVLLNIAVYCQVEENRNFAVKLLLSYINKFDWNGRYHQIMHVISTSNHSGSQGLVINLFKNYLHASFVENISPNVFIGNNLTMFIHKAFFLPDGVETDILENCDKIITSLNLLRYLLLRDEKEANTTGIWNTVDKINDKFLAPLQKGIDLSRAHYKLKLRETKNSSRQNSKKLSSTISINNESVPDMPPDVVAGILNRGLTTFDMIESVLARVREILPTNIVCL